MGKPKVLVTRRVPQEGLDLLREKCDVDLWDSDDVMPRGTLLKRVQGAEGIFCTINDQIDSEVLDAAGTCTNNSGCNKRLFSTYNTWAYKQHKIY